MDQSGSNQYIRLAGIKNWNIWKFQVGVVLKAKGVFEVTDGTIQKPVLGVNDDKNKYEEELRKWQKRDNTAQEILVSRMEENPMSHILNCETSNEMWIKLKSIYEQKSDVSLHLLQQRFFNFKYDGEGIALFASKIEDLRTQLSQMGENVSDKMIITKIIMSLPEEFKHFQSAWESVPVEKQYLNDLISRLLIEEERIKTGKEKEEVALAAGVSNNKNTRNKGKFFSRGSHNNENWLSQGNNNKNYSKLVCFYCKKHGHIAKDCWFKKKKDGKSNKREETNAFITIAMVGEVKSHEWILDSGASEHMSHAKEVFSNYKSLEEEKHIKIGDGSIIKAVGIGTVKVLAFNGELWIPSEINNVLHVPNLKANLFSAGSAIDKGYIMISMNSECKFKRKTDNKVVAIAKREGKLYKMQFKEEELLLNMAKKKETLREWHEKLAHQNYRQVRKVLQKYGIECEKNEEVCEVCYEGKQHRKPFTQSQTQTTKSCEIIHADICGPMEEESIGKSKYFLMLKDDYSHYRMVYFLKHKFEAKDKIKCFIRLAERNTGNKIKILRSDNGLELVNEDIKKCLEDLGIRHQKTVPYTPEQNGKVEREMRTVVESARTMLRSSKLDKKFWAEAVNTAVYTLNRTGTSSIENKSPYELWFNKRAEIDSFHVFGSSVYVHVPKEKRKKWDSKTRKGIFVGYEDNTKGYRIYFSENNKIEVARDVEFIPRTRNEIENKNEKKCEEKLVKIFESDEENELVEEIENFSLEETEEGRNEEDVTEPDEDNPRITRVLRDRKNLKLPHRLHDYETSLVAVEELEEPLSFEEAVRGKDSRNWKKAIEDELKALEESGTWKEVNKPDNAEIIDSRWVFKIKKNEHGELLQYKARLVAKGFQQREGLDLNEIYAPVAKLTTLRVLLVVAANLNLRICQMDVKSAFLYGDIKENVYMHIPEGVKNQNENKVWKLYKSLYGLKKSPRYWNEKFNSVMIKEGFSRSKTDYCLYYKNICGEKLYIILYVDDLLIIGSNEDQIKSLKEILSKNFKMKDMGNAKNYLGINIVQDRNKGKIEIHQIPYLKEVLRRFGMEDCKTAETPMEVNFCLQNQVLESKEIERACRKLIGSLMYAMVGTRPDLCIAVSILSRYQSLASVELLKASKRVLRYIKGTLDFKLVYKTGENASLCGYVDSDWGSDKNDRKSTTGYVFKVFNSTVSWKSRKQTCVSLSSTEAEYYALSEGASEACWLRNLLSDIGIQDVINVPTILYEDNQSAIRVTKNPENNTRMKHIDIRCHFVRDKVAEKVIDVSYIESANQTADMFTKPLGKQLFQKFCQQLGLE